MSKEADNFFEKAKPYIRNVVWGGGDGVMNSPITEEDREWSRRFHAHLDACKQCERNPFDLCPIGARILMRREDKPK